MAHQHRSQPLPASNHSSFLLLHFPPHVQLDQVKLLPAGHYGPAQPPSSSCRQPTLWPCVWTQDLRGGLCSQSKSFEPHEPWASAGTQLPHLESGTLGVTLRRGQIAWWAPYLGHWSATHCMFLSTLSFSLLTDGMELIIAFT